jgi:hypothetical protein
MNKMDGILTIKTVRVALPKRHKGFDRMDKMNRMSERRFRAKNEGREGIKFGKDDPRSGFWNCGRGKR